MVRGSSPTVRRRQLGARLRELRTDAGMLAEDVAERLLVSPTKISRIETGARAVQLRDVRDLCDLYQVSDEEREHLMSLARESRQSSWWQRFDLSSELSTFVGLEAAAVSLFDYSTSLVPGLLQTEAYIRALHEVPPGHAPDPVVTERQVKTRLTRQRMLDEPDPPQLWVVVDEAALRREVGGKAVMREQVDTLVARSALRSVTIQIIPFEAGAHPAMDSNFTIMSFGGDLPEVISVEGLAGSIYLESSADVERYHLVFDQLRAIALGPRDSVRRLQETSRAYAV